MAGKIDRLYVNKEIKDFNSGAFPYKGVESDIPNLAKKIANHLGAQSRLKDIQRHLELSWDEDNHKLDTNAVILGGALDASREEPIGGPSSGPSYSESVDKAIDSLLEDEDDMSPDEVKQETLTALKAMRQNLSNAGVMMTLAKISQLDNYPGESYVALGRNPDVANKILDTATKWANSLPASEYRPDGAADALYLKVSSHA